jgi:hypothetical protein
MLGTNSLKNRIPVGLYGALRLLRDEINMYRLHRKGIKKAKAYARQNDIKLNIGCGPNRKPSWVNIDLLPDVDVSLDMREPMPFPDNSVTIVYSEHFFEHLDYPSPAKQFLKECHRILNYRARRCPFLRTYRFVESPCIRLGKSLSRLLGAIRIQSQ